jgi:hypothetical protein
MDRLTALLRYLRIAVTALSLTACLLVIVLFARSFRTLDLLELYSGWGAHIASFDRGMEFCVSTGKTVFPNAKPGIRYQAIPKKPIPIKVQPRSKQLGIAKFGFHAFTGPPGVYFLQFPNWFLVLIAATLSVAPWLKRRFSLRILLIAMSLVALLLGMIAVST